ncbi:MAG: phosphatidylserine decarboxylase proenzyme [Candidatus Tectimicrobiota bacterium]|nr:MAG: phosphatidylserine decarboxylase proenzyme [Candidatus Tectomicrobia bacterium]
MHARTRWRLAPEGWPFVLPLAMASGLALALAWWIPAALLAVLGGGVAFFFRDPERQVPDTPGAVVAPADGRVIEVGQEADGRPRVGIFLSLLDVHVNRAPYGGTVRSVTRRAGRFVAAYRRQAPQVNACTQVIIDSVDGEFTVTQIAGVLARRIVCHVRPGDALVKGQRYGLIRFGSRTDLVLPRHADVCVQVGARVRGGETILAFLKEPQRP